MRDVARRAFPHELGEAADEAAAVMPAPLPPIRHAASPDAISVRPFVQGQQVAIPYRIYVPQTPSAEAATLGEEPAHVLGCLYTRHHDGYVRERSVSDILEVDRLWVVPFVVQLLGEYVVEIAELILQRIDLLPRDSYDRFASENDQFLHLTRQHIISYWTCYYRGACSLAAYPPVEVMTRLDLWKGNEGLRRLSRSATGGA